MAVVTPTSDATDRRVDVRSAIADEIWSIDGFVADVLAGGPAECPFDGQTVAFCVALSRELLKAGRAASDPGVVTLGYWLRPASIERMRQSFATLKTMHVVLVPRGRVFHVTPANVDTLFVYSWALALLTGNANVVRLSTHVTEGVSRLLDCIARVLADPAFADVRRRNWLVRTERDDAISRALSATADVRVIWGGDATVERFRQFPLPPRGRDVVFPNRHSLAIIDARTVRAARDEELATLADQFFNDAYWFDQAACSSPRLVVWFAPEGDDAQDTRRRFHAAMSAAIARRSYKAEIGTAIDKMVFSLRRIAASDGIQYERASNEATWLVLPSLEGYDRDHSGGGLFFEYVSHDLASDLVALARPQDQTAACYGLPVDDIRGLVRQLNGRGFDRWVSIGRALEFAPTWDGYDLLSEFVKRVVIDV